MKRYLTYCLLLFLPILFGCDNTCSCETSCGLFTGCSAKCPIANGVCLANCTCVYFAGVPIGSNCGCGVGTAGAVNVGNYEVVFSDVNVSNLNKLSAYLKTMKSDQAAVLNSFIPPMLKKLENKSSSERKKHVTAFYAQFENIDANETVELKEFLISIQ